MDLRSAHKTPETPPPRVRLSLTRSLVSQDERHSYDACKKDPQTHLEHRKSQSRRSHFTCLDSDPPSPTQEDWEEEGEEEEDNVEDGENEEEEDQEEEEKEKEEARGEERGILNSKCVSWSASWFWSSLQCSLVDLL